ncbi:MAG: nucleoside 2-deoxyribosyltransferase [Deltaproteobacteria bacterium]|nr:nucleoside 2-deoxyribosyltransferase [Deltaproteobacteria bacterium]
MITARKSLTENTPCGGSPAQRGRIPWFWVALLLLTIIGGNCAPSWAAEQQTITSKKIYCAGPLFNDKEREEMAQIAQVLEQKGFMVFLPHRDGVLLAKLLDAFSAAGVSQEKSREILLKVIFYVDVFELLDSDGLILNMNGRVPDEGSMVEAGIAWQAGKAIVIYKNDDRSLVGGNDNPLVVGLSGFQKYRDIDEIPNAFQALFATKAPPHDVLADAIATKGRRILEVMKADKDKVLIAHELMQLLEE